MSELTRHCRTKSYFPHASLRYGFLFHLCLSNSFLPPRTLLELGPVMALIPLALALSNSSTVLSWLCVHVPHHLLVLLLLAGAVLVVALVATALLTLGWLTQKLLGVSKNWLTKKGICTSPPKSPRAALRLRTDTRHFSCPGAASISALPSLLCWDRFLLPHRSI